MPQRPCMTCNWGRTEKRPLNGPDEIRGLRRDRETDEGTDTFTLKRILSSHARRQTWPRVLTTAFTSAVRSAQIDPPQRVPANLCKPYQDPAFEWVARSSPDALSTHAPLMTRPSKVRRAAPTRNSEYGEYENFLAGPTFSPSSAGRR